MNYEGDNAVVPHMGNRKAYKVYSGNYLLYVAALTVAWASGESSGSFSDDYSSLTQRAVSENNTITHSEDLKHTRTYSEACGGLVYLNDYIYNSAHTARTSYKVCHSCNHVYGELGEYLNPSTHEWEVASSRGDTENTIYSCTRTVQKQEIITDCPGGTNHGTATIKITGGKTLSIEVTNQSAMTITGYKWYKDDTFVCNGTTCNVDGSGTYKCEIQWDDTTGQTHSMQSYISTTLTLSY